MKILYPRNIESFAASVLPKSQKPNKNQVQAIIDDVQKNGDPAIKRYEKRFSGATPSSLRVSKSEVREAYSKVSKIEVSAIKEAKKRLEKTENAIKKQLKEIKVLVNKTKITKSFLPISSVGCYVPGGLARYPSSVVMSTIPAKVAGVKRVVVVSPPNKKGKLDPLIIIAADICGADEIFKTGGAQAIAALAYGTNSINKVDKIVGPGGPFVSVAKSLVSDKVAIDMIAGPTELGIIADNFADPNLVAADLISQAEHSPETFCFAITQSQRVAQQIQKLVTKIMARAKRKKIIKQSLKKNGFIAVCENQKDIIDLANTLAPEHLEIITKNPRKIAEKITTAGLVLLGKDSPSSASDYMLGTNHILPTSGFGKTRGSLSVLDFVKLGTTVESSRSELRTISKYIKVLSKAEGLENHYEALRRRL